MIRSKTKSTNKYNGYVSLTAVIILTVIVVSTISSILLLSTSSNLVIESSEDYKRARQAAEGCVETTLNNLQLDLTHPAGDIITFGTAECEVIAILGSGNTARIIQVEGRADDVTSRVIVETTEIVPDILIVSWSEVDAF